MTRPRILAGLGALALIALISGAGRRLGRSPDATLAAAAAKPTPVAAGEPPRAPAPYPSAAAATAVGPEASAPPEPPRRSVSGVAFAEEYADTVCRCTTAACVEDVRVRYSLELGRATPSRDSRGLHEALRRAAVCREKILSPAGG